MTTVAKLSDLELAALLCSKLIHDVIGSAGAIVNGLEMLEMQTDENLRRESLDMMDKSARKVSAHLQFARIAFGAAGSAGSELDLGDVERLIRLVADPEKVEINWQAAAENRPKDEVKLLLNLVYIGFAAIPYGGTLKISVSGQNLAVRCIGKRAKVPDGVAGLVAGEVAADDIDAR